MVRNRRSRKEVSEDIESQTKVCYSCNERLPFIAFNRLKRSRDGYDDKCRNCHKSEVSSYRDNYRRQKYHAKRRGIDFLISYEEWLAWWGGDIRKRGRGLGMLQMCRNGDKGAYELNNIFKGTHEQNMRDKIVNGTHRSRGRSLDEDEHKEVCYAIAYGMSTRAVARSMGVSQRTIVRANNNQGAYETH